MLYNIFHLFAIRIYLIKLFTWTIDLNLICNKIMIRSYQSHIFWICMTRPQLLYHHIENYLSICSFIQLTYFWTFVYTPGIPSVAHPMPQETIPEMYCCPSTSQTNGPPESPWQASLSEPPAQIMELVFLKPVKLIVESLFFISFSIFCYSMIVSM